MVRYPISWIVSGERVGSLLTSLILNWHWNFIQQKMGVLLLMMLLLTFVRAFGGCAMSASTSGKTPPVTGRGVDKVALSVQVKRSMWMGGIPWPEPTLVLPPNGTPGGTAI